MQMQNQHLLQQMTERDDYNIKVYFATIWSIVCHFCMIHAL